MLVQDFIKLTVGILVRFTLIIFNNDDLFLCLSFTVRVPPLKLLWLFYSANVPSQVKKTNMLYPIISRANAYIYLNTIDDKIC